MATDFKDGAWEFNCGAVELGFVGALACTVVVWKLLGRARPPPQHELIVAITRDEYVAASGTGPRRRPGARVWLHNWPAPT